MSARVAHAPLRCLIAYMCYQRKAICLHKVHALPFEHTTRAVLLPILARRDISSRAARPAEPWRGGRVGQKVA